MSVNHDADAIGSFARCSANVYEKCRIFCDSKFYLLALKNVAYYFFYYVILFGLGILFFALGNFIVLFRDIPPLTGYQSLLKLQPALSILPRPDSLTSLIRYQVGKRYSYGNYIHDLFSFIQSYERHVERSRLVDCTHHVAYIDHPKFSCKFSLDLGTIGCNLGNQYGYDESQPCILVRLNRIIGWMPQFGEESLNGSLRNGFPAIKIKCEGINEIDKENIGRICYYDEESALRRPEGLLPDQEGGCSEDYGMIRHYYFPYKKQMSYQVPFVWVKFSEVKRHVVVLIQCWPIVNNIDVNVEDGTGYVRFEILID